MILRFGTKPAIKDGLGHILNYSQMAERINSIAYALQKSPVSTGQKIGVFQDPTCDWICSLLAILRVGAIYIPLNPRVTVTRLAVVVGECQPTAILMDAANESGCQALDPNTRTVDVSKLPNSSTVAVHNRAEHQSTAVIIYTSGSTGIPKGMVMRHNNFRNNIESSSKRWFFKPGAEVVLQQSGYNFDMFTSQTFLALSTGSQLYAAPKSERGDPTVLSNTIMESVSHSPKLLQQSTLAGSDIARRRDYENLRETLL